MKYFEKLQTGDDATTLEDLDISIHCDVNVFEWLMKYLINPQAQIKILEVGNVISILISADYLQMNKLVDDCVKFIKDYLLDIIKLPIDTNCISPHIFKKLASITEVEVLDEIKERKDKFISKVYMKKLEILLSDENNTLFRCVYCNKLFTHTQKAWMVCPKANIFIDFHGSVIAEHMADRYWNKDKFLLYLRNQGGLSYKEIYYKIESHLITLHCGECDKHFVGAEIGHCIYHSQKAKFGSGSNNGSYQCCGEPAIRFDKVTHGCTAKLHRLASTWETPENKHLFEELIKRQHIIAEPFISEAHYTEQYNELEKEVIKERLSNLKGVDELPLSKIKNSPPLQVLMKMYVGRLEYAESEDEDSVETRRTDTTIDYKKKTTKMKVVEARQSSQKLKDWRLDALRSDDRNQIENMIKKLKKFREDNLNDGSCRSVNKQSKYFYNYRHC